MPAQRDGSAWRRQVFTQRKKLPCIATLVKKAFFAETLTATVSPANAADAAIVWTSDNKNVATVANGVVTAKAAGTAHISAVIGGVTATCTITVLGESARGDVNYNGKINIVDAQVVYDLAKGTYGEDYAAYKLPAGWSTSVLRWAADVNSDNDVDALDAFAIQYFTHYGSYGTQDK